MPCVLYTGLDEEAHADVFAVALLVREDVEWHTYDSASASPLSPAVSPSRFAMLYLSLKLCYHADLITFAFLQMGFGAAAETRCCRGMG